MTYDVQTDECLSSIKLENRGSLAVTGVEDVSSFDEALAVLYTKQGTLIVRGSQLHLDGLNLEVGEIGISGEIDSLQYENAVNSGSLLSRLFG